MDMTLKPGTQLGPYEIISAIGAGGMGEVYRARDPRVGRDVAIKISAEQFSERFEREIHAVASLNHSNICTLYDVGPNYLVMELIEGPTLADRIKEGALPLEESLEIARQIAYALEAAHEKGIIHRDLKPGNIKIRPDGTVKVLDFGLAKVGGTPAVSSDNSPTLSVAQTAAGVILGTAAYMSPEQAKGKTVDKRADIWAFGCVLFEMLTGHPAFQGEDVSEILASVIKGDLNQDLLPAHTHPDLRKLLGRCLQKDLKKRYQDIGDLRFELEQVVGQPAVTKPVTGVERQSKLRLVLPWVAMGVILTGIIVGMAAWALKPASPGIVTRFAFTLPADQTMLTGYQFRPVLSISPDGTEFVYPSDGGLYLKRMSEVNPTLIRGTETANAGPTPTLSPDGRSVIFYAAGERAYKRITTSGGSPMTLCEGDYPSGVSWGANDQIVIAQQGNKGILRISAKGGKPETIVAIKEDESAHGPQILPGGKAILFTLASGKNRPDRWDRAQIVVQKIDSGERKIVVEGGTDARYLPTGHIVYAQGATLWAVPFDLKRLEKTGEPVSVLEGVGRANSSTGAAHFSISDTGTLIYVQGTAESSIRNSFALVDRSGHAEAVNVSAGLPANPRISPNGKLLAYQSLDNQYMVSVYDLSGTSSVRRLTFGGNNRAPLWSGDGERLLFASDREGDNSIFWQRADGAGSAERVSQPEKGIMGVSPTSFSRQKQLFAFNLFKGAEVNFRIFSLQDKKAIQFSDAPSGSSRFVRRDASFSPDGRWLAYQSDETGRLEVYVQPFPATGTMYQITKDSVLGSHHPLWSPDGKELFYIKGTQLFSVGILTEPAFTFSNPVPLPISGFDQTPTAGRSYDVTPDGKRFIMVFPAGQNAAQPRPALQIQVVLNWTEELKQRVPVK